MGSSPQQPSAAAVADSGRTAGSTQGAGKHQLQPGVFYPDANSTLRVSIGKVDGYFPRDGLIAAPRSRLVGIVQKSGEPPFDAPEALIKAIHRGENGPYADPKLGSVSVNYREGRGY